jgi:hypothetical protein
MDIVERLRKWMPEENTYELLSDAADEIEQLRKKNAELRKRTEWLPIEPGPNDGTMYFFGVCKPDEDEDFRGVFDAECFETLLHWMPMAKTPKTTGEE